MWDLIFLFSLIIGVKSKIFVESSSQSGNCSTESGNCLTQLQQIKFVLNSLDQNQKKAIVESFNKINDKQGSAVDSSCNDINYLLETLEKCIQKDIIEYVDRGISNGFLEAALILNRALDVQIDSVNAGVTTAVNTVNFLISLTALLDDATILTLVRTPRSSLALALTVVINKIAVDNNKLGISSSRDIKKNLRIVLLINLRKIASSIKDSFSKIKILNIKSIFDNLIKELKEILNSGKGLMICGLEKANMKIIGSVKYLLSLCVDKLNNKDSEDSICSSRQRINPFVNY